MAETTGAAVAQWVEQLSRNPKVTGVIPGSSELNGEVSLSKTLNPKTAPDKQAGALRGFLRYRCVNV